MAQKAVTGILASLAIANGVASVALFSINGMDVGPCDYRGTHHDTGCKRSPMLPASILLGLGLSFGAGAAAAWWQWPTRHEQDRRRTPEAQAPCAKEPPRPGCTRPVSGSEIRTDGVSYVVQIESLRFDTLDLGLDESDARTKRILDDLAQRIRNSPHRQWKVYAYCYDRSLPDGEDNAVKSHRQAKAVHDALNRTRGLSQIEFFDGLGSPSKGPQVSQILLCPVPSCPES